MVPVVIMSKYQRTVNVVRELDQAYYQEDKSPVPDAIYDGLRKELLELEAQYPDLITPLSPSQLVGFQASNHFTKVKHDFPMLSLDNAFSLEELQEWFDSLPPLDISGLCVEYKFDGVSLSLTYKNGVLVRAVTRGDGEVGEDVTLNARYIDGIPQYFNAPKLHTVVVRGEVLVTEASFTRINEALIAQGKKPYANKRNYASGALRQKDPLVTKSRELFFRAYTFDSPEYPVVHHSKLNALYVELGFGFSEVIHHVDPDDPKALEKFLNDMAVARKSMHYDIDGLVFKVDSQVTRDQLGFRSRSPKWAIAYKFPATEAVTTLESVTWQVGRTGVVTPVGNVAPVFVHGTTVSNVTLHNVAEIQRLDLHLQDKVVIKRAGDVIPSLVNAIKELRPEGAIPINPPKTCPCCDTKLSKVGDVMMCLNHKDCRDQVIQRMVYGVSRKVLNINHMGIQIITKLYDAGLCYTIADILALKPEHLREIGLGDKMIEKLMIEITDARVQPLQNVIKVLEIPEVAEGGSKRLAEHFKAIEPIRTATQQELEGIKDIGAITAGFIVDYMDSNGPYIDTLLEQFTCIVPPEDRPIGPLDGKRVVVSGSKFAGLSRSEVETIYRDLGAKIGSDPNKNTWLVVLGVKHSKGKYTAAQQLGIPYRVYNETALIEENGVLPAIDIGTTKDQKLVTALANLKRLNAVAIG